MNGSHRVTTTVLFTMLSIAPAPGAPGSACAAEYAVGADLSFLRQAEDRGTVFRDNGQAKPGLQIFKDHGYNWIRLRLFHTPSRPGCPRSPCLF